MTLSRRQMMASAGALALPGMAAAQAGPHDTLTVRVGVELAVLDPAYRINPYENGVSWAIFQRLVKFKPGSTEWEPDAAETIAQTSPTTVEFTLRDGLRFSDGSPLTTDDVKFSFERIARAPAGAEPSPYKQDWGTLDRVEALDARRGRIVLTRPTANFFRIALADGSGCIVPRAVVEKLGVRFRQAPVGSGPYALAKFEPKQGVTLQLRPGWPGAKPHFPTVVVRSVPDAKTAELAFKSGELDFTELTPSTVGAMKGVSGAVVDKRPGLRFVWISLNVEKPPLDNPKVRQAIAAALDPAQMILAGYQGMAPLARALIQPQVLGYWKDAPAPKRDVALAKRLLQEAGVPAPHLKLTVLNDPAFTTMAVVAQAQAREAGIVLDVDARDGGTYWSSGKGDAGKQLDLVMQRFNGKLDPNFETQWFRSEQVGVWNWARWASPAFDRLDDQAASELDEAKRAAIVIEQQKLMAASGAFLWLTYDVDLFAYRSWLKPAIMPTGSDWQYADFTSA